MKPQSEEGFVLVVSLGLLVILALLGMFATRMATTEYQIAGNERVYTENFYHTESVLMDFAQEIDDETDLDGKNGLVLSSEIPGYDGSDKEEIVKYLDNPGIDADAVGADKGGQRRVLAVRGNVVPGNSYTTGGDGPSLKMYAFDIFARSQENGTDKIIKVGLKKQIYGD